MSRYLRAHNVAKEYDLGPVLQELVPNDPYVEYSVVGPNSGYAPLTSGTRVSGVIWLRSSGRFTIVVANEIEGEALPDGTRLLVGATGPIPAGWAVDGEVTFEAAMYRVLGKLGTITPPPVRPEYLGAVATGARISTTTSTTNNKARSDAGLVVMGDQDASQSAAFLLFDNHASGAELVLLPLIERLHLLLDFLRACMDKEFAVSHFILQATLIEV